MNFCDACVSLMLQPSTREALRAEYLKNNELPNQRVSDDHHFVLSSKLDHNFVEFVDYYRQKKMLQCYNVTMLQWS